MALRILCSGDIHIGRQLSKIGQVYRTVDAWNSIVDLAIDEKVDLLALSGDLIDRANTSYEALGPMQHGLSRLNDAGIETVAVAGNHDFDVLVKLEGIVGTDRFHLLGKGGVWERFTLVRDDTQLLHVDGWSFPSEHTSESPMRCYSSHPHDGVPVMGLLHGDVGASFSRYAPIALTDVWSSNLDFLLLGHIHAPRVYDDASGKCALYPGSPWPMDPGEPGVHGPWIVTFDSECPVQAKQIAISPVRYISHAFDVTGVEDEAGFQACLSETLTDLGQRALAEGDAEHLRLVSVRLTCSGETPAYRSIPSWVETARAGMIEFPVGSIILDIDEFNTDVRPPVDLANLAQGTDPLAETARLILALNQNQPTPIYLDLLRNTHRELIQCYEEGSYDSLRTPDDEPPSEKDAQDLLRQGAWDLLSTLMAQKEAI